MNFGFGRGCCSSDKKFAKSCFIEGDSFKLKFFSVFSLDFDCIKDLSFS